jgi:phage-related protein
MKRERKKLNWLGNSREELRTWPKSVTEDVGGELLSVQEAREPSSWKPMPSIGAGVNEIRISVDGDAYRVIYIAKFVEAIYVLHAFQKKTQKTPKHDLDLAKKRFSELCVSRKEGTK